MVLICWMIVLSLQTYHYPEDSEINKRLKYLQRVIEQPLDENSEILKLGNESREWMLFSYSFSTYAMTNIALRNSAYKTRVSGTIKEAIEKVLKNEICSAYDVDPSALQNDSIPEYSILYLGHLNLMLGCYRLLTTDDHYHQLHDRLSASLFYRYKKSSFYQLPSYPNYIWIPDNTVGIASLKLHSQTTGSKYDSICGIWVKYVKTHYVDHATGTLYSTIDSESGIPKEEPRGSMLGWSIMFISHFDPPFAKELYQNYKKHFSNNFGVLRLFKERYNVRTTDVGDIDSGPVFLGYSMPANQFALAGAVLSGDMRTAKKLERLTEWGTKEVGPSGETKYQTRFVELNISPMAEALVLYGMTMTDWQNEVE